MQQPTPIKRTSLQNIVEQSTPQPQPNIPYLSPPPKISILGPSPNQHSPYLRHTIASKQQFLLPSMAAVKSHQNISWADGKGRKVRLGQLTNLPLTYGLALIVQIVKFCAGMREIGRFGVQGVVVGESCEIGLVGGYGETTEQSKSKEQHEIIAEIVQKMRTLTESVGYNDFYTFYKRVQKKNKCNFKYFLMLIQSYCRCSKIQLNYWFNLAPYVKREGKGHENVGVRAVSSIGLSNQGNLPGSGKKMPSIKWIDSYKKIKDKGNLSKSQKVLTVHPHFHPHLHAQTTKNSTALKPHNHKIQSQFQIKIRSHDVIPNTNIKQSTVSTNFKTSAYQQECKMDGVDLSFTFHSRNGIRLGGNGVGSRVAEKGKSGEVEEVQSQYESSTENDNSSQKREQKLKNDRCHQIIEQNHWQIQNIFTENRSLSQSIITGKDQERKDLGSPKKLEGMARVLAESYLNNGQS